MVEDKLFILSREAAALEMIYVDHLVFAFPPLRLEEVQRRIAIAQLFCSNCCVMDLRNNGIQVMWHAAINGAIAKPRTTS